MNDFFGYIVHQDRMADFTREADQSRLAAQVTGRARGRRHLGAPRRLAIGILVAVLAGMLMLATSSPDGAAPARPPVASILA